MKKMHKPAPAKKALKVAVKTAAKKAPPKHGKKLRGRGTPDAEYVKTLREHGGWMSAKEVADKHGHSWYSVSHALCRQVEFGAVEDEIVEVVGAKRSFEHTRVYRARPLAGEVRLVDTCLPAWLQPQGVVELGQPRRIQGKAGMSRWTLAEKDSDSGSEDPDQKG